MMRRWVLFIVILAGLGLPANLWGGTDGQPADVTIQKITFSSGQPQAAYLYLDVTGADGSAVPGLKGGNFKLVLDGQYPVTIDNITPFAGSDRALAYVLLVDNHETVATSLTMVRHSAVNFIEDLGYRYWGTVVTYAEPPGMLISPTRDAERLVEAVSEIEPVGRSPQLAEGMLLATDVLRDTVAEHQLENPRTVIILFTEGLDQGSMFSLQAAAAKVLESGAQLFLIGYGGPGTSGIADLKDLADKTGGRWYYVPSPDGIPGTVAKVADILKYQYILVLDSELVADGEEHSITVTVSGAGLQGHTTLHFRSPGLTGIPVGWPLYLGSGVFLLVLWLWRRNRRT